MAPPLTFYLAGDHAKILIGFAVFAPQRLAAVDQIEVIDAPTPPDSAFGVRDRPIPVETR